MQQHKRSYFSVLVSSLFLALLPNCTSDDSIKQNQSVKDGDLLVSNGNSFAFGFFSPATSANRYLGIWYNKVSEQTIVWVANRDNPINGTSGVVSIEKSGDLVLRDRSSNLLFWSTNVSRMLPTNSSSVQLTETGNLVLFQDQSRGIVAWESFDYPTNTLLPQMKHGVNRTSGFTTVMTSWKAQDNPGTGDFRFKMEVNGSPEFFLYKGLEPIWRTGPWNGIQLSGVPDMTSKFIFTVTYVDNHDEVSLSYSIHNPSIFSRLVLNESGTLERLTWQEGEKKWVKFWSAPKDQCDYYSHCGKFSDCDPYNLGEFECKCLPGFEPKVKTEWDLRDAINGCTRKKGEQICGNRTDGFIKLTFVKVPDTSNARVNSSLGLKECEDFCLKNCSCTAYTSANISNGGSGCITWFGDLIDIRQFSNEGQDVYFRVTAAELAEVLKRSKGSHSKKVAIIVVASVAGVLLLIFTSFLVLRSRKGRRRYIKRLLSFNISPKFSYGGSSTTKGIDESSDLTVFDLRTITSATDHFSLANKLGEGGFGTVYKGQLHNGREIAIKRLSKSSGQGTEEFKNEVTLIARLQHRNLVKLLGCCIQQEEKMLVYEYLPNKGLDNFIFDKEKAASLTWRKRHEIILGIARGLVYLHRDSRLRIIHRDMKASNVLLDSNMEPKISDFGMARIFGAGQMEANTNRVVGTYGYMSPEYAMQGLFSDKSDVFSFGVLLLEIISGRKNNSYFQDYSVNLIGYVWDLWKENKALEIVDPSMVDSYNQDEVLRCIQIGLLCVQEQATDRPNMSQVLSMLSNETALPSVAPKQPAFVIKKVQNDHSNLPYSSSASLGALSVDDMTITVVHSR